MARTSRSMCCNPGGCLKTCFSWAVGFGPDQCRLAVEVVCAARNAQNSSQQEQLVAATLRRRLTGCRHCCAPPPPRCAVALTLGMLFVVINPLWYALDGAAVWVLVTIVVVLEPTLGATLRKVLLRSGGTILAGAVGLAILYLSGAVVSGFDYDLHPKGMAVVVTCCTAAAGALLILQASASSCVRCPTPPSCSRVCCKCSPPCGW